MLKQNVGGHDRILRIFLGLALILGFFINADAPMRWLYLLGIVPVVTGLLKSCPLYTILGLNTCPLK